MSPDVALAFAAALYAVSSAAFAVSLAGNGCQTGLLACRVLALGVCIHAAGLAWMAACHGASFLFMGVEGLSVFSWMLAVLFLVLRRWFRVGALGVFVAPLVLLHLLGALAFQPARPPAPEVLRNVYVTMHVLLAFLGDSFLALAAAASVAFLVQERQIRLKRMPPWAARLPNLEAVDRVAHACLSVGFVLMSLGIASGAVYAKHAWHSFWNWDPRQVFSLMTWIAYAVMLQVRFISGWHGRKLAWLTVAAFALVASGAVMVHALDWGLHTGEYRASPESGGGR